jgi:hypothetical protein
VLAGELGPVHGPLVVFASETGLRPSEWLALERRDVRDDGVVLVERTCSNGTVRTRGSSSPVPAPATSTCTTGGPATGRPPSRPRVSPTARPTRSDTPSPPTRSRPASASSSWPGSWARASSRSAPPTGTCSRPPRTSRGRSSTPTRTVCAACVTRPRRASRSRRDGKVAQGQRFRLVGAPRFELGTSSPPDWRANQAAPRPVPG